MVVGATFSLPGVMCVDTDNLGLATAAANYLAELGHKTVAFVGGSGKISNDRDRHSGFLAGCRAAGISVPHDCVIRNAGWRMQESERLTLEKRLQGPNRPTAVFAAGYHFALDTYAAALNVGLRVPQDLSVIGVDDPPSASFVTPPLTTFRQQMLEMGRAAVRSLFEHVQNPELKARSMTVQLPAEFVERLSCAAASAASGDDSSSSAAKLVSKSVRPASRDGRSLPT
jgi:LacI family transcriptional regulator